MHVGRACCYYQAENKAWGHKNVHAVFIRHATCSWQHLNWRKHEHKENSWAFTRLLLTLKWNGRTCNTWLTSHGSSTTAAGRCKRPDERCTCAILVARQTTDTPAGREKYSLRYTIRPIQPMVCVRTTSRLCFRYQRRLTSFALRFMLWFIKCVVHSLPIHLALIALSFS